MSTIEERTVTVAAAGTSIDFPLSKSQGSIELPVIQGTELTFKYRNTSAGTWTTVPVEGTEANPATVASNGTYRIPIRAFTAKYLQIVFTTTQDAARNITVFLRD